MEVLGITGSSGSDTAKLVVEVLPFLKASGLSVSIVKYTHHGFDMDQPGKDSHRHRLAGAHEVLIASSRRWALLHETGSQKWDMQHLLACMAGMDLVLIEGIRSHPFPRLEVFHPELGNPPLWYREPRVVAVVADSTFDVGPRTLLPLNQPETIATWIRTRVVTDVRSAS